MKRREFIALVGIGAMVTPQVSAKKTRDKDFYYFELLKTRNRNIRNISGLKSSLTSVSHSLESIGYRYEEEIQALEGEKTLYFVPYALQIGHQLIDKVYLVFNSNLEKVATLSLDFFKAFESFKYEFNAEYSHAELLEIFTPLSTPTVSIHTFRSQFSSVDFTCRISEMGKFYVFKITTRGNEKIFSTQTSSLA